MKMFGNDTGGPVAQHRECTEITDSHTLEGKLHGTPICVKQKAT